jgi:hypothetical protein
MEWIGLQVISHGIYSVVSERKEQDNCFNGFFPKHGRGQADSSQTVKMVSGDEVTT